MLKRVRNREPTRLTMGLSRDVKMDQACQPAKKRTSRVEIFSPSAHCNSARQFSGPKRVGLDCFATPRFEQDWIENWNFFRLWTKTSWFHL